MTKRELAQQIAGRMAELRSMFSAAKIPFERYTEEMNAMCKSVDLNTWNLAVKIDSIANGFPCSDCGKWHW